MIFEKSRLLGSNDIRSFVWRHPLLWLSLGMGNPSDPPTKTVIEKLVEAARDPRNHGYSKSNGIDNLRREVAGKYFKKYGVRLDPDSEVHRLTLHDPVPVEITEQSPLDLGLGGV